MQKVTSCASSGSSPAMGLASAPLRPSACRLCRPHLGHMFLVIVDAHSKWMEINACKTATSTSTIEHLRTLFATDGLPELLQTDNGSVFTSSEFTSFLEQNGIRHPTSAPYHPATNGLEERAVQTFKEFIRKPSQGSLHTQISRFLFQYRITPHSTTGVPLAKLLLGRRPRSILDLALPSVQSWVTAKQEKQRVAHDRNAKARTFAVGVCVYVRDFPFGK